MNKANGTNPKLVKYQKEHHEQYHDSIQFVIAEDRNAEQRRHEACMRCKHRRLLPEVLGEHREREAEEEAGEVDELHGPDHGNRKVALLFKL